jgi:hypothetical protein
MSDMKHNSGINQDRRLRGPEAVQRKREKDQRTKANQIARGDKSRSSRRKK